MSSIDLTPYRLRPSMNREERERQLQKWLFQGTEESREAVRMLAREAVGIPEGALMRAGTMPIETILKKEFPEA